jgi:hypothetical protein
MHCDFNLLGLISILDECSYVSNWLLRSSPVVFMSLLKIQEPKITPVPIVSVSFLGGTKGCT